MEVQISGCVLSSLFLELANSEGDIEGFLLGKISHRTTNTVSDSQEISVEHQCIFAVQEVVVCQGLFSFYDGVGRIHVEKLNRILGKNGQDVLGWFKFRRNSRLGVSMREKAIHKNLVEQFGVVESENFVFSVFTSQTAKSFSTHAFQYSAFYTKKHIRMFHSVPVNIINLGNTSQTEYKQDIAATRSTSKQYQNVIGSFRDEFLDNVGQLQQVKHARSMYTNMLGKLKGLKEAVHSSETQLTSLSNNIESLKHQVEKVIQEKRLKPKDSSLIVDNNHGIIYVDESESSEQDLISFEDVDSDSTQEPMGHIVVAKLIDSLQETNTDTESIFTEVNQVNTRSKPRLDEDHRSTQLRSLSPHY